MWTVIYIASNSNMAERIKNRLTNEGFLVKIRQSRLSKKQYEILVLQSELEEVQEVLSFILQKTSKHE
ncbi:glutamate decarboxylase [Microaerobacter geothermalis]|uniref:glutamate decarboxylase n=1 Tax=Microaerobacter geothermalis TaxID=674972 RepID=UPI001F1EB3C2|nr:glutamate decarboxylase [Microaerobacter geothermalis]MCF6092944.1 glutamate decarboxylase [Microaerobacter geothermalis]